MIDIQLDSGVSFFSEHEIDLPGSPQQLEEWINSILDACHKTYASISYVFVNDTELLEMNRQYLDHDTLTDILTFPYNYDPIETEIYISYERVNENALQLGVNTVTELLRVMAHGVLHMCGFDDTTPEAKQDMRAQENKALEAWNPHTGL